MYYLKQNYMSLVSILPPGQPIVPLSKKHCSVNFHNIPVSVQRPYAFVISILDPSVTGLNTYMLMKIIEQAIPNLQATKLLALQLSWYMESRHYYLSWYMESRHYYLSLPKQYNKQHTQLAKIGHQCNAKSTSLESNAFKGSHFGTHQDMTRHQSNR